MWLNLNLDGIKLYFKVSGYHKSGEKWYDEWCSVEFTLQSDNWLNYTQAGELLLACEIEELESAFTDLLQDKISNISNLEFIEPDMKFVLEPKRDLRDDPRYTYVKPGCEIVDITAHMHISFWDGGLTANYLSLALDRDEILMFATYLKLIMGRINLDDLTVQEMLKKRILLKY